MNNLREIHSAPLSSPNTRRTSLQRFRPAALHISVPPLPGQRRLSSGNGNGKDIAYSPTAIPHGADARSVTTSAGPWGTPTGPSTGPMFADRVNYAETVTSASHTRGPSNLSTATKVLRGHSDAEDTSPLTSLPLPPHGGARTNTQDERALAAQREGYPTAEHMAERWRAVEEQQTRKGRNEGVQEALRVRTQRGKRALMSGVMLLAQCLVMVGVVGALLGMTVWKSDDNDEFFYW